MHDPGWFSRRLRLVLAVLCGWWLPGVKAAPADDPPGGVELQGLPPLAAPYATVSLRGMQRSLDVLDFLFESVLRPDMAEAARKDLIEAGLSLDESQGLDVRRPVGYLFTVPFEWQYAFLLHPAEYAGVPVEVDRPSEAVGAAAPDMPPQFVEQIGVDFNVSGEPIEVHTIESAPVEAVDIGTELTGILFASITDRRAAKKLLGLAMTPTTTLRPVGDRDDLFQGFEADEEAASFALRLAGNDVYLSDANEVILLEQVVELNKSPSGHATRHDALATVQLGHLPVKLRKRFSELLWQAAAPGLQQRDAEPEAEFALRDATERSLIELVDMLVTGVEEASAAADLLEAERLIRTRFDLTALEETELAQRLADLGGPPSMFLPLHDPGAALSLSISVKLTDFEQQLFSRWVRWARACTQSEGFDDDVNIRGALGLICDSLQATIDAGHLDLLMQLEIDDVETVGLVGGLRLSQPGQFRTGIANLADVIDQRSHHGPPGDVSIDAELSRDLMIHRYRVSEELDLGGGEQQDLDVSVAAGRGALWFAGGTFDSLERLKRALDQVEGAAADAERQRAAAPFLLTASASEWQKLPFNDDFDTKLQHDLAVEAFAGDDGARLELRPMRQGARLEGSFEAGFLRWIALLLAHEHDVSEL